MKAAPRLDALIHPTARLQICALLSSVDAVEFATIRDSIGVSDSVLSKHLKLLEEAGYVTASKVPFAGRQRTWLSLTEAGRTAFSGHVAELRRLAELSVPPGD